MTTELQTTGSARVLLLAPTRRDGEVTLALLGQAGIDCALVANAHQLAAEIDDTIGAIVLTDAVLSSPQFGELRGALHSQPNWSDIPVVLLGSAQLRSSAATAAIASLNNVMLLERPTSMRTLLSAVQTALRGRARQYEIRDQVLALSAAEDALRTADRLKDEFLAMLAHELRNPLASLRNAGELLSRSHRDDLLTQASVGIVQRQTTQLTRLVDDLLDVSRITRGRIELQRKPLDVAALVTQALETVEPLLQERCHKVEQHLCTTPVHVSGDAARLVQCISNLLINAAKYTDSGGRIVVSLAAGPGEVVISVSDNGVGICADLLSRVFDLFVQSDRSLDRSQGGLGIGLSVVQRLVGMHGGKVTVRSPGIDRGSVFEITLPRIPSPDAKPEPVRPDGPARRRVLVVDDNIDAASSLALLLEMDGHETEPVFSASRALDRATGFEPDIVLLDIGLPEMDGYEVARRLRAAGNRVKLVALTGYGQIEDIEQALAAGFDAHLVKPVDMQALDMILAAG